jgi:hypothetical protein
LAPLRAEATQPPTPVAGGGSRQAAGVADNLCAQCAGPLLAYKLYEYTIPILLLEKGAPSAHSIGADGRHRMRESERQGGGEVHARYLRFCLAEFCFVKTTATL